MIGKRVQFDDESWQAIDLLARDSMKTFQELADEAFADLLKKHGRPADLKTALKRSAREPPPTGGSERRQAAQRGPSARMVKPRRST
jgi:hypothetical protein